MVMFNINIQHVSRIDWEVHVGIDSLNIITATLACSLGLWVRVNGQVPPWRWLWRELMIVVVVECLEQLGPNTCSLDLTASYAVLILCDRFYRLHVPWTFPSLCASWVLEDSFACK